MICWTFTPTSTLNRPRCQCGQVRHESHVATDTTAPRNARWSLEVPEYPVTVGCSACCKPCNGLVERQVVSEFANRQIELVFEKGIA